MKRKLDIYRQEKIQDQAHNHRTKSHIDTDMINSEFYLRELAIRTTVLKPKDVNVLLGTDKQLSFHQSEAEMEEQKGKQADDCVCFGLLDKNAEDKVQFLHRTYAEYLVAEYIYKGFHVDDKRHNRLLENEPVRGLIIKILAYRLYEGVQVFINSMFKEIVDQDGNWREIIDNRLKNNFPDRFKIFTKQWKSIGSAQRFLEYAIRKKNGKIFKFFCDCFDVMFDSSEFRRMMKSIYSRNSSIAIDFYAQSSEVFERFIKYYDTANKSEVKNIFQVMLVERLSRRISLDYDEFEIWKLFGAYPFWKNKEKRKVVDLVLDFLVKHQKMSKEIKTDLIFEDLQMMDILHFFVSNDYYDCLLSKWLGLLLSMYCDDDEFFVTQSKLLLIGIYSKYYKNYKNEVNMEKMLTVLRDLGRYQVLERISRLVLLWDSHIFGAIYQPNEIVEGTGQLLSSWTLFQRVAFDGDTAAVANLLENKPEECKAELLKNTEDDSNMAEKEEDEVIEDNSSTVEDDMVRDNEVITPFYIAAATGHKEMCHKLLLAFLKQSLTDDELKKALTHTAGLVHCALRDAINFQRLKMFELILTATKRELGHNYLLDLLKSEYPNNGEKQTLYYGSAFAIERFEKQDNKLWLHTMIDTVVWNENEEHLDWNGLSELVLQDKYSIRSLYYFDNEIFKEMHKAKGFTLWIQLLLDIDIYKGFNLLCYANSDFERGSHSLEPEPCLPCPLRMFDEFELSQFIAIFTSTIDDEGNFKKSYWKELLNFNWEMMEFGQEDSKDMGYSDRPNNALAESLINFLECIYEKLSTREVNERLFDHMGIVAITQSMLLNLPNDEGDNPINYLLVFIQDCQDEEVKQHLMSKMPLAIEIAMGFPNRFAKLSQGIIVTRLTIVHLVLENARYSLQLPLLVDALLKKQEDDRKKRSIWSYYFKYCDKYKDRTLPKKMGKFLKLVSEKHENGSKKVKELVLQQYDGEGSVTAIRRAKLTRRPVLVKAMLAHLNEEDRQQVRCHVDTIEEHEDSSDSWDEDTISNSDESLATGGNQ